MSSLRPRRQSLSGDGAMSLVVWIHHQERPARAKVFKGPDPRPIKQPKKPKR
jgi:hypothetical protein